MKYLEDDTFNNIEKNSLLLVLDVQNKYNKYYNKKLIKNLNSLISLFLNKKRPIVFTRFFDKDSNIYLENEKINNLTLNNMIKIKNSKIDTRKLGDHLVGSIIERINGTSTGDDDRAYALCECSYFAKGKSERSECYKKIECDKIIKEYEKLEDNKNVYFMNYKIYNPFSNSKFLELIKREKINRIYICGGFYTFCVLSSVITATNYNILPIVIEDGIFGMKKLKERAIEVLKIVSLMKKTKEICLSNRDKKKSKINVKKKSKKWKYSKKKKSKKKH